MQKFLPTLKRCELFSGFTDEQILSILSCLDFEIKSFNKNNEIFQAQTGCQIGVVLSGTLHNIQIDYDGNQNILAIFSPTDIFGESLVFAHVKYTEVNIIASENSEIMFLNYEKILTVCGNACVFHQTLIKNIVEIIAQKNVFLTRKLRHVTKRSTREKLMSYLFEQASIHKSRTFTIPLNRQQLADYLAVDRSAMSAELCKLRDSGVIKFRKNEFCLLGK